MLQFHVDSDRCVRCGECAADCPLSLIDLDDDLPRILAHKEKYCIGCQHCLAVCPTAALSILGTDPDTCPGVLIGAPEPLESAIMGRRSVRRFRPDRVDPLVIDRLLRAAAHAPTGKNRRQVRFTVVDDPLVMDRLRTLTMDGIRQAVLADRLPESFGYFAKLLAAWDGGKDIIFRNAPHMLIVSAPDDAPSPEADPYIALTTFELLAHALGLGTLWCGFAMWAVRDVVPQLGVRLGIPAGHTSQYAMLFGHPAVRYWRTVQRELHDVHTVDLTDLED